MRPHPHWHHGGFSHLVPLRFLPPGSEAIIVGYAPVHQSYRSKLLSMGLTKGTRIRVKNIAPLGDPVHISVRDFELSLRADEADALLLEPVEVNGYRWGVGQGPPWGPRGTRPRHHEGQPHNGWPQHRRQREDRRWRRWLSEQVDRDADDSGDGRRR